jgi:hypothetical protein
MSDGLHLDGLAIVQTDDPDVEGYRVGATYHPDLATEGFYHGLRVAVAMAITALVFFASDRPDFQQMIDAMNEARDVAFEIDRDAEQRELAGEE